MVFQGRVPVVEVMLGSWDEADDEDEEVEVEMEVVEEEKEF